MLISVVIPTYNRKAILEKCLLALENQVFDSRDVDYEIIVVDDGSTDGTPDWIRANSKAFSHLKLIEQAHGGPAAGRNLGVENASGEIIVFIDSDLVVTKKFLSSHLKGLIKYWNRSGDKLCFTYGSVINTSNFDDPSSEPHKLRDLSWAYFATGNVAIDRKTLLASGLFDVNFTLYGWEDLELGERLRYMGVELLKCPEAVGYHWHPSFKIDQMSHLIRIEKERAKMGLVFYKKHPTLRVRFIIQFTILHRFLWELLTLFGLINDKSMKPFLAFLIRKGYPGIAIEIFRLHLNRIGVIQLYKEARASSLIG